MNTRYFRPGRSAHGFTLVELLVVIAIIGVLIALLLPAVQAARAAARRAQCKSNLKQIGLAVLSYTSGHAGELPPGGIQDIPALPSLGDDEDTRKRLASWSVMILPFLELEGLYDQYDFRYKNLDQRNLDVLTTIVGVYLCPSDEDTLTLEQPRSGSSGRRMARGSYRANAGKCGNPVKTDDGANQYWADAKRTGGFRPDWLHWKGPFHATWPNNPLEQPATTLPWVANIPTLSQVTDGQSNTFFIGEGTGKTSNRSQGDKRDSQRRRAFWAHNFRGSNRACVYSQSRTLLGDYALCKKISGSGPGTKAAQSEPCKLMFGSLHPDGIHFAYGDGSVKLIAKTIDVKVYAGLATMAGQELID